MATSIDTGANPSSLAYYSYHQGGGPVTTARYVRVSTWNCFGCNKPKPLLPAMSLPWSIVSVRPTQGQLREAQRAGVRLATWLSVRRLNPGSTAER
jgi:hypothetical protein